MEPKVPTAPPAEDLYWEADMEQLPFPYEDYIEGYHPPPGGYPYNPSCYPLGHPYRAPSPTSLEAQFQPIYADQRRITEQRTIFMHTIEKPEPDYLVCSLITMLFCCLPLGIAALVFSLKTRDNNRRGNGQQAKKSSQIAGILNCTALGIGLILGFVCFILIYCFPKRMQ